SPWIPYYGQLYAVSEWAFTPYGPGAFVYYNKKIYIAKQAVENTENPFWEISPDLATDAWKVLEGYDPHPWDDHRQNSGHHYHKGDVVEYLGKHYRALNCPEQND